MAYERTNPPTNRLTDQPISINPRDTGFAPLDWQHVFGNDHPVVLEIGSGKGRFLIGSALEQPQRNFVGIEKSLHYHRVIADRVAKRGLTNVRLINHDAFLVLQKMIADASLSEVHIYFPDPWPRPREQKRRIVRPEVLTEIRRTLRDDGFGIFVTDHLDYFEVAAPLIESVFRAERRIPGPDDPFDSAQGRPARTNYEAKYRAQGRGIYEVRFRK